MFLVSTLLFILFFISVLQSCYLRLNLCERNEVTSDVRSTIANDFKQVMGNYAAQREQAFETLYHKKISLTCAQLMYQQGFDGEKLLACMRSEAGLNRANERVYFSQVIQQVASNQIPSQKDSFYSENLAQITEFKINLQYEPIMLELFEELEKVDDARIKNKSLALEQQLIEPYSDYQFLSAFNGVIRHHFPVKLIDIDSKQGFWATVFSSSKSCTVQVKVGRVADAMTAQVNYDTKRETETSGRTTRIYFGAHIKSIVGSQGELATPEARVNYFMQKIHIE